MSMQALRERLSAINKEAKHLLAEKGSQTWGKEDQAKFDNLMDEAERAQGQIAAYQRTLDMEAEDSFKNHLQAASGGKMGDEAVAAVALYLRFGNNVSAEQAVQIRNAMSTTTPAEGGFTVPALVEGMVVDALKAYGGMRGVATVITTAGGNAMTWPTSDGTAEEGEIVAENGPAAAQDITFGNAAVNPYMYSSKKLALPLQLIQDSAIDVVAFVTQRLAQRLGRITNKHYTNGTGSGQPFGIVQRASLGKTGITGQTLTVTYDDLVDLFYSVNSAYRGNARWSFADSSLKVIRKLKDSSGRPIFTPGYEGGITEDAPDMLLGKPITINDDVPAMAANARSIVFGDHSQYTIRDVAGSYRMLRFDDSAFALNAQVGFCGWMRTGGNLLDAGAVKYYANSAT